MFLPRKLISNRALKARILRALAKTAFADVNVGAEYLYDDIPDDENYEPRSASRQRQAAAMAEEIALELGRRADKLERADQKEVERRRKIVENRKR